MDLTKFDNCHLFALCDDVYISIIELLVRIFVTLFYKTKYTLRKFKYLNTIRKEHAFQSIAEFISDQIWGHSQVFTIWAIENFLMCSRNFFVEQSLICNVLLNHQTDRDVSTELFRHKETRLWKFSFLLKKSTLSRIKTWITSKSKMMVDF